MTVLFFSLPRAGTGAGPGPGIVLFLLLVAAVEATLQVRDIVTIAGNFSLSGKFTNLAHFDVTTGEWSSAYEPNLYVYGESNGVLWDTKVNRSSHTGPEGREVDELIVVGAFDTVSKTSQILYCSVGIWTGLSFDKVGEGLCPRGGGSSNDMLIQTSAIGSNGDLFVGGYFESRVWDGNQFSDVFNIAYFQGASSAWLPLKGGKLTCKPAEGGEGAKCFPRVSALEWDAASRTLFIGGKFNYLNDEPITSGLCMWTEKTGLMPFSSDSNSGLSLSGPAAGDGEATVLTYDARSQSLFVAGSFSFVAGLQCSSIAVWHRPSDSWTCLDTPHYSISTVTAMCLDLTLGALYLAGWASFQAKWEGRNWGSPYAISRIDVRGYIEHHAGLSNKGKSGRGGRGRRLLRPASMSHFPRHTRRLLGANNSTTPMLRNRHLQSKYHNHVALLAQNITNNTSRRLKSQNFQLKWNWLPGFAGGNGPIFNIVLGRNQFKDCLFISGAFNNGPPIVLWAPSGFSMDKSMALRNIITGDSTDCTQQACAFPVGSDVNIYGLVTSVSQLQIPVQVTLPGDIGPDDPAPRSPDESTSTLSILFAFSISIGICLGIAITFKCMKNAYHTVPLSDPDDREDDDDDDENYSDSSSKRGRRNRRQSVTLGTLSTGGNRSIDLKACYEKAMKARHLNTYEMFETINPQEIELITTIGEGSFGTVWRGIWRNNSVAVKEFGFAQAAIHGDSQQSEDLVVEIIGEAGLMTCLGHPNILQLYGCSLTSQAAWIVCELCERGSLRMLLDDTSGTPLSNEHKLSLCLDVADGMQYLHRRKKPIIHRDLKSYNIFIIEKYPGKYTAKIGDWGSARAIALSGSRRSMTQGVGTACWLAPEAIKQSHFSKASDVYSFGIVLWEICTRRRVHEKLSDSQIIARVANDGLRPEVPVYCPWNQLMQHCWKEDPSARPTFKYIVKALHRIYDQERAGGVLSVGKLTSQNLNKHLTHHAQYEEHNEQNRRRHFYHSDNSSDDSKAIGDSF